MGNVNTTRGTVVDAPPRSLTSAPRPAQGTAVVRDDVEVSWGDLDPAAIVFYPRFFAWADAAAHRLFRRLGLPLDRALAERRLSFGLVACSAEFHSPARFGDRLSTDSRVSRVGSRSLDLEHVFRSGRRRVATVREVRVCMDLSRPGRLSALPLPDDLRRALSRTASARVSRRTAAAAGAAASGRRGKAVARPPWPVL